MNQTLNSNKSHSLNNISDEEHDYKVSPLASTVKSSSEESKGTHSHSRRSGSSLPEDRGSIHTTGDCPRSRSVGASDKSKVQNNEETKEGNVEMEQPVLLNENNRSQNEYGANSDEENEGGSLGDAREGDSNLTDDEVFEGGSDESDGGDDGNKGHYEHGYERNRSSSSSYGHSYSQPTDQSEDKIDGLGFNNQEENKTESSGVRKSEQPLKTDTIISKIENLRQLAYDIVSL